MCWINWFTKINNKNILDEMNQAIKHRWPDDSGIFFDLELFIKIYKLEV